MADEDFENVTTNMVLNPTKYQDLKNLTSIKTSVAEPKLFIFGSDFDHNFGSSSSYSHILAL